MWRFEICKRLQTPLLALTHESSSSGSMKRVFERKPQCSQSVPKTQSVGRKEPLPPSWQRVSPATSAAARLVQGFAHALKGSWGGGGE